MELNAYRTHHLILDGYKVYGWTALELIIKCLSFTCKLAGKESYYIVMGGNGA